MKRVVLVVLLALAVVLGATGGPALAGGIKTGNEIGFEHER